MSTTSSIINQRTSEKPCFWSQPSYFGSSTSSYHNKSTFCIERHKLSMLVQHFHLLLTIIAILKLGPQTLQAQAYLMAVLTNMTLLLYNGYSFNLMQSIATSILNELVISPNFKETIHFPKTFLSCSS